MPERDEGPGFLGWGLMRRLLPTWYRERYAEAMAHLHLDRARRRGFGAWRAWWGLAWDVVWTAAELHFAAGEGRGDRSAVDSGSGRDGRRRMATMTTMVRDGWTSLRLAGRSLARRPSLTLASVATLAVGVGVTVAVADVVYTVLAAPLPYRDSGELVQIVYEGDGRRSSLLPPGRVRALRAAAGEELTVGVAGLRDLALHGEPFPERVRGVVVTGATLPMLGVEPWSGRLPDPAADRPGGPCQAVLSHTLWSERFGSDPGLVGGTIPLDGGPCLVTAVMPPGFAYPAPYFAPGQMWVLAGPMGVEWEAEEGRGFLVFGRRSGGLSGAGVGALLDRVPPTPGTEGRLVAVEWAAGSRAASERRLVLLLAASALLLVLAGLNFTALQLARAEERGPEVATRMALGAGRGRLLALLGSETVVLVLGGAGLASGAALGMTQLIVRLRSFFIPRMDEVAFGADSVVACLVLAGLLGLAGSAIPAARVVRQGVRPPGSGGVRHTGGPGRRRLGRGLVALEATVALVLLAGSILLLQSYRDLFAMDAGFATEGLLHARVTPVAERHGDPAARAELYASLEERLTAVPGIRSVGLAFVPPGVGGEPAERLALDGDAAGGEGLAAVWQPVSSGYLGTLGVPVLRGRGVGRTDDPVREVVVNETFVRRYGGGEPVLGRTVRRLPAGRDAVEESWVVVGVVADIRETFVHAPVPPAVYASMAADPPSSVAILSRTDGEPMAVAEALRRAVAEVEPAQPVYALRPLDFLLESEFDLNRLGLALLALFAGAALVLAGAGIHGVAAHTVGRRRREMGIRLALGARSESVHWMVVLDVGVAAAVGLTLGLVAVGVFGDALRVLTPGWAGIRPGLLAVAALWVALTVLAAVWIPARRAAQADPVEALRQE